MKVGKKLGLGLAAGLILPLIGIVSITSLTSAQSNLLAQANTDETPRPANRDDRVAEYRQSFTERLTATQQARIRNRCEAAQQALVAYGQRLATIEKNRINAYDKINDRLSKLIDKIGDQVSTDDLKTAQTELQQKTGQLESSISNYRLILADITELNCVNEPVDFRAGLEAARTQRAEIATDSVAVRSHISDAIVPALQSIRDELRDKQGEVIN